MVQSIFLIVLLTCIFSYFQCTLTAENDMQLKREEVKKMFYHAYDGYLRHAYPFDELRPLTCDGVDTWGSFSLTLIDALDMLVVLKNYTEFRRVSNEVITNLDFDQNVNVSVFETNIRVVGGLLSAHLLSYKAGVDLHPEWPCQGPLLKLAEKVARKLLPAFETPTGMPYGTVNLKYGVDPRETVETCTAGVGTFILEFGTLSRLTGDPKFEEVALQALHALNKSKSDIGLVGNHVNIASGKWTANDAGVGAGVDSFYEYLVKGAILLDMPVLMDMFREFLTPIETYVKHGDWYLWVNMKTGQVTLPIHQSLDAFWPGLQTLYGDVESAYKTILNYYSVWKRYGGTPEFFSVSHSAPVQNREGYPLRPELIESTLYLYRATRDPLLLDFGKSLLRAINTISKTECGFATIKDVRNHRLDNRMESFFLAETIKYLYLLFDPDNELLDMGRATVRKLASGRECILGAGGYVFNTEAHPIDVSALHCCNRGRSSSDFSEARKRLRDFDPELAHETNPRTRDSNRHPRVYDDSNAVGLPSHHSRNATSLEQRTSCAAPPYHVKFMRLGQIFVDD